MFGFCYTSTMIQQQLYKKRVEGGKLQGHPPTYVSARTQVQGPMPVWAMITLGITSVIALVIIIVLLVMFIKSYYIDQEKIPYYL